MRLTPHRKRWLGAGGLWLLPMWLLPAAPALAFDDVDTATVTLYQPGGLEAVVVDAAMSAAARNGISATEIHAGTINLLSVTRNDQTVQAPPPGFQIPMSAIALAAGRAAPITSRQVANALARGLAVMGETSAALRGARPGDVIEFLGWDNQVHTRRIGLVVPDRLVNWAELAFDLDDAAQFGFWRPSALVMWDFEPRDQAIIELWRALPARRLRVDSSYDPWNPDSVVPTVLIKQRFGEFAYRKSGRGDLIQIEPGWREANIVEVELPLVGPFRCHRAIAPLVQSAIQDVIEAGLSGELSYADFQLAGGCWVPRVIRGGDKGGAISRHAWGVAVDFNPSSNPYGGAVDMHPEIVEIFRSHGFAWGGGWTFTDGGHFEWNRDPGGPPLAELAGS